MRKSKAHVFRRGLNKDDLLREPISLYFGTMAACGESNNSINITKQHADEGNTNELQSQANVIQNLCLINMKLNANGKKESEIVVDELPKLSDIKQATSEGYIADIKNALTMTEQEGEANEKRKVSCILPRTTCEYEKSLSIHKIKAIRGISPKKDIPVKLPDESSVLLVSKVYFDSRFQAVAHSSFRVHSVDYNFMRISSPNLQYGKN